MIIFLNEERFLEEAIRSVFAQTYDRWELMLVDDGSTDGSTAIARRYADEHPERVRYLEHPGHENRGMSAARNLGFRHTRGSYIALLDGDDVWFPNKLRAQVAILDAHPAAALTYGRTRFWYGWTDNPDDRKREWFTPLGVVPNQLVSPPVLVTNFLRNESTVVSNCSVLVRRAVIEEVNGWEESFRTLYEDMVLWTKIFTRWPVFVSDGCWDLYRQHAGNSVVGAAQEGVWDPSGPNASRHAFLNWVDDYVRQNGIDDDELRATLAKQLLPYRKPLPGGKAARAARWMQPLKDAASRLWLGISPASLLGRASNDASAAEYLPALGHVRFGGLRRLEPVSRNYGFDRGTPVDRFYIEAFLRRHAKDIRGRVLEFGDSSYTRAYGGNRCTVSDVWHGGPGNTAATIAADLSSGEGVAADLFDCIICTQVLFLIYDIRAAARTLFRILKPGGVLLVTLPGIAKIEHDSGDFSQDCWRLTERSARLLFADNFPPTHLTVSSYGNVSSTVAFLEGVSAEELSPNDFEHRDPRYPLIVSVRAVKQ